MNKSLTLAVCALVFALGASAPLTAQIGVPCPLMDDGFNVGCCNQPMPNLPQFPSVQTDGRWGCLLNCNLEADFLVNVSFSAPIFVLCDYALITVTVTPGAPGAPAWSGTMLAKYSRTWMDAGTTGAAPRPRWRFLLNGDLNAGPSTVISPSPCPYPPQVFVPGAPPQPIHVVGHIDYICGLGPLGPVFRTQASLTHFEGCIAHAPWTQRPLPPPLSHIDRSYHLVSPSTFSWSPTPAPSGPMLAEAVRSATLNIPPVSTLPPYICHGEANVLQGSLSTQFQSCLCGPTPTIANRWRHQNLSGVAGCAGAAFPFNSLPVPGTFLPTGMACLSLGSWPSLIAGTPGEGLHVYFGVMLYSDPCNSNNLPFHIVTGVATTNAPGTLYSPGGPIALTTSFIDLQNAQRLSPMGIVPTFGAPFFSTIVWNLNTP